jgi:cation:H+ antiporter
MEVALALGLLIVGLVILIVGADWFVKGAASFARLAGMPAIVIGLTIVSFGTSAPELAVNLFAAFSGSSELAIGNIVGSNVANIFLILGIAGVIAPLSVKHATTWKEIPLALLSALILLSFASDRVLDGAGVDVVSRAEGFAFLGLFVIFLAYVYSLARREPQEESGGASGTYGTSIGFLVVGLVALIGGGKLLVDNAITLATIADLSEAFIGLTVVAVGTSLPELATSAVAAWRGHVDIAIGNVVGSSIFNVFWILGITAVILPLPVGPALVTDIAVSVGATLLLFAFMFIGKRHLLERWQGALFILLYIVYLIYLILRG